MAKRKATRAGPEAVFTKKVRALKKKLGRKVCGARRAQDGEPCTWPLVRGGKRCLGHGGLATGGPPGNKNAVKHGLYLEGICEEEYPVVEQLVTGFIDKYKLDPDDPRTEILLNDIITKTIRILRGYSYLKEYGVVETEEHDKFSVRKSSPALDVISRLCESRRRDMQELLGPATGGGPLPGGAGNPLDPATRDAMIMSIWNKITTDMDEAAINQLLEGSAS